MTDNHNNLIIDGEIIEETNEQTIQNNNDQSNDNHQVHIKSNNTSNKISPILYGIIGGFIGSALFFGFNSLVFQKNITPTVQVTSQSISSQSSTIDSTEDSSIIKSFDSIKGAVVSIINYQNSSSDSYSSILSQFFNNATSQSLVKTGEGSGVIYKVEGEYTYIVTNNHVIEGATELNVQLSDDNHTTVAAEIIGHDKLTDLAVIRIKAVGTTIAKFANSDTVITGQTVLAIGSPLGSKLSSTLTKGIVSANKRSIDTDTNGDGISDWTMETIQTDAAINPGNSGGALVDVAGQVIGINSMKVSSSSVEGIGFAIPSNQVVDIINKLETNGSITRPVLGISIISLSNVPTTQRSAQLQLPSSINEGIVITNLQLDSLAQSAGLKVYDVITKVDNQLITDLASFRKVLYSHNIGDSITLTYYRSGKEEQTQLTLK